MTFTLVSLIIGLVTGVLSGMFGVGGAIISTPAIRLLLNVAPLIAVGTTLPVVLPAAVSGGIVYWRNGLIDKRFVLPLAGGGIAGSLAGAFTTRLFSGHILLIVTAGIIAGIAGQFMYEALSGHKIFDLVIGRGQGRVIPEAGAPVLVLIGAAAGFVSGLLGIGGAIILNPVLVFGFRVPIKKAFGTSLLIIAIIAIPGSIVHALLGHVDWGVAAWLSLGVVPGGYLGAKITAKAKSKTVEISFGLFLLAAALILALSELAFLLV